MDAKLMKGSEVALFLRCSKALAYRLIAQGDIPSVHYSRKTVRVKEEDLLRWLEIHTNNGQTSFPENSEGSQKTQA